MSHNPYAPSKASMKAGAPQGSDAGVWREGKTVVCREDASMPRRCVKCNDVADEPTKVRTIHWHHPAIYLILLFNLIVYMIVALIVRKKALVDPGLCLRHKVFRRNVILGSWAGFIAGALAIVFAIQVTSRDEDGRAWVGIGFLLILVSLILGIVLSRVVFARRIEDGEVRLGGCKRAFLDSLPEG